MNSFREKYGYRLLVILTAALIFLGFQDYFIQFAEKEKSVDLFPSFLNAAATVLIYAIPLALFIWYLARRWAVRGQVVLLSSILAFTLPLYLGSQGNSLISLLLFALKVPMEVLDAWGAALTAPFAEEIAKGAVVLLVFGLCRGISLREAFISGMISGFGFQVLEDWAYIFQATFGEENLGFSIAFERLSNALGSHTAFGIVFGMGLIALLNRPGGISKGKAIFLLLAPVALHFAWNSPLDGDWVVPLFGSININLAYYAFTLVEALEVPDQGSCAEEE